MENKLQELTQKLYNEGLSKGKQESEQLIANAKNEAEQIIADAKKKAAEIVKNAEQSAEDMKRNTITEVGLASREIVGTLKQQIEDLIILKGVSPAISQANTDPEFIKEILLTIAKNWNGESSGKIELTALLPADKQEQFTKVIEGAVVNNLQEGLEIKFDNKVKSGFKIGPKDGGYYISFSDDDFNALFKDYLRPLIADMLFSEK